VGNGLFRLRICFSKTGRLRWLAHLEVVRAFERAVRRAPLEYAVTQGFNPKLRIAFGPALPVGTAGEREWADVWLTRHAPAAGLLERLREVSAQDLAPIQAGFVAPGGASLSAVLTVARYEVVVEGDDIGKDRMQAALDAVLATGELAVEHKGNTKVFGLALSLPEEPSASTVEGRTVVRVTTRIGEHGSLRPEALVTASIARAGLAGAVRSVARTDLLVECEDGVARRPL